MTFHQLLAEATLRNTSLLCVGIDPDVSKLPASVRADSDAVYRFCVSLIEATAEFACAFKPNSAFFEALGVDGIATLQRVIAAVPAEIPVILDAKRGDIGSTAAAYARAAFEVLGAHAVTLNPYLGTDALAPFLGYHDRGCFILCKTSNPGSADLQDTLLADGRPLYAEVARRAQADWNTAGNVGLVVGATHPAVLRDVRALCPTLPFLIPGVGAQGGDLLAAVAAAANASGAGFMVNASRSIIHASLGADYAEAARVEAERLRNAINQARGLRIPAVGSQSAT